MESRPCALFTFCETYLHRNGCRHCIGAHGIRCPTMATVGLLQWGSQCTDLKRDCFPPHCVHGEAFRARSVHEGMTRADDQLDWILCPAKGSDLTASSVRTALHSKRESRMNGEDQNCAAS
ncbi:hypothetical protein MUK42_11247 [Musa troglodytarum]|uniref:Uncharacterized protein n=1 Tax=Musa troglodytarum TaxID=320322 RepID=A0A9E7FIZ6_9LILI|nr:hypothetical protein MUK42_11247 [Musa troglodytarum]